MKCSVQLQRLKTYKVIIQNAGYLSAIEVFRLVMPFVAMPYVISTVGAKNYGIAVYAQTIISYFTIFINWGLDVSAVKDVSIWRGDRKKLNEIVSSVLGIKLFLLAFSFGVLLLCTTYWPFFEKHSRLYFFAFITCFSEVLYPVWFYMGIEKMKFMTVIKSFSIFFYVITVFIFIRKENDYEYVVLLQSLGNLLAGVFSMYLLLGVSKIRFVLPEFRFVRKIFVDSVPFFISRLSVIFNGALAKTVSGIVFPMEYVTALDLAGKVSSAGLIPMQTMNLSVYPHIAKTLDRNFVRKYLRINIVLSLAVASLMFLLAPVGIPILAGGSMDLAVNLTRILSIGTFFSGITTYIGSPVLVAFGYPKPFNLSVIYCSVLLILIYAVVFAMNAISIYAFAAILCIVEFFDLIYRMYYCCKYKLIQFCFNKH